MLAFLAGLLTRQPSTARLLVSQGIFDSVRATAAWTGQYLAAGRPGLGVCMQLAAGPRRGAWVWCCTNGSSQLQLKTEKS